MREGLLTAYTGIVQGLSQGNKANLLVQHVQTILHFIVFVWGDKNKTEEIISQTVGLIGDLAQNVAQDNKQIQTFLKHQSISQILNDSLKKDYVSKTAQWALDVKQFSLHFFFF